jgi:hypothetical protein
MHNVTRRSHQMQKHMFGVRCPGAIFVVSVPVSHRQEKLCIDVSCPIRTKMHYMTRISNWMQKHMFGKMCTAALFMETTQGHQSMKNSVSTFHASDEPKCIT